jgi:hypothetical protein
MNTQFIKDNGTWVNTDLKARIAKKITKMNHLKKSQKKKNTSETRRKKHP